MLDNLLNKIISLKEERRVLEIELGLSSDDPHVLSRNEISEIEEDLNVEKVYNELEEVNLKIVQAEKEFVKLYTEIDHTNRTERWNKEYEGMIYRDKIRKMYERENIYN